MRYGVLGDLARKVFADEVVDLSMGHFNCIWQGDANAQTLAAFDHLSSPPNVLNVTGPEVLSVRRVCEDFGRLFGKAPCFAGTESDNALLSKSEKASKLFGHPRVGMPQMLEWIADWITRGGASHGKPTHFEARDGRF
jgi:hypothetical protein